MTEQRPYSLAQLTRYFLKLGSIGFGGPVAGGTVDYRRIGGSIG